MYDELINFLSSVGFPIVISLYLLFKLDLKLEDLSKKLSEIQKSIKSIIKKED